jgi:lysophospholipid acyltransferase (LPLAT)-like uncharacterized protein
MTIPDRAPDTAAAETPEQRARRRRRVRRQRLVLLAIPLVRLIIRSIWATLRIETIGLDHVLELTRTGEPFIACFWHQRQFICMRTMLDLQKNGLKMGFLLSPSSDGDIAARLLGSLDVQIMRGSASRTGAHALRDLYKAISVDRISLMMTADGPKGPIFAFKPGTVLLAQLTGAPIVPMTFVAKRAWTARSWDHLVLPKPFTRVVAVIGKPRFLPKGLSEDESEKQCREMERLLAELEVEAASRLSSKADPGPRSSVSPS